jgi:hypothetical protein
LYALLVVTIAAFNIVGTFETFPNDSKLVYLKESFNFGYTKMFRKGKWVNNVIFQH